MNKEEQTKEVYAFFGLTFYYYQVLEHEIINILISLECLGKNITRDKFDEIFENYTKPTMGKLIKEMQEKLEFSDCENKLLAQSLYNRNYLAHEYFRKNAINFITSNGMEKMLEELKQIMQLFIDTNNILTEKNMVYMKKYGITEEVLNNELENIVNSANSR